MPVRRVLSFSLVLSAMLGGGSALAGMSMAGQHAVVHPSAAAHAIPGDTDQRQEVHFPPAFKRQELSNMRSHLEAVQAITQYLAAGNYQAASDTASHRLTRAGMSAEDRHQSMQYMPKAMLAMGEAMHRSAGHFAIVAQDAAVTGDARAALGALAQVEAHCVACHRTYRLR